MQIKLDGKWTVRAIALLPLCDLFYDTRIAVFVTLLSILHLAAATIAHRKAAILNGDIDGSEIRSAQVKRVEQVKYYEPDPIDSTQIKYPKALDLIGNTPL